MSLTAVLVLMSAITAVGITAVVSLIVLMRLREHRIDLPKGAGFGEGASPFWQVNVMRAENYSPEGRKLLSRYHLTRVAFLLSLIYLLAVVYRINR